MIEWKETDIGLLPLQWKLSCVDEIKSPEKKSIISGPFGSNISSKFFVEDGTPVIRGNNLSLKSKKFIDDGFVFLTREKANELNTWAKADDLIFTAAGTIGQVGIIQSNQKYSEYIISNKQLRLRVDASKVVPLFAYYWFSSLYMQEYIITRDTGSTIPLINLSVLKSLPIPLPQIKEQQEIVKTILSLDNKIDLLRRQNQTLEQLAQTIFKQWFVLFQYPGANGKMQQTELGEVPVGWRVGRLGDVMELVYGKALKTENRETGLYPVIGSSGVVGYHDEYFVEAPGIVIGRKGTIGKVNWLDDNFWPIDTTYFIKDLLNTNGLYFHYFILKQQDFEKIGSDSAVPGLNRNMAQDNEIIIPEINLIKEFNSTARSIFKKKEVNQKEIQTLTQLRDSLLPRLMSGRLRVG